MALPLCPVTRTPATWTLGPGTRRDTLVSMGAERSEPSPDAHTVLTPLGEVRFVESGPPDGDPVLIVHGSPGGYDVAAVMGRFLARLGFRIVAPSRPGYPGTPLTEGTTTADDQARLLVALLDELEIDRAGVLTWSGGGPCGYRMAVNHPDRLTALVAVAALSGSFDWQLSWSERLLTRTRPGALLIRMLADLVPERLIAATLAAEGDLTPEEVRVRTADVSADPERRAMVLQAVRSAVDSKERAAGLTNDSHQFAVLGLLDLPRITVPTLVVHGDADTDVDPEYSDRALAEITGSVGLTMPRGTHLCLWVDPGYLEAQATVAGFLKEHATS